MKPIDKTISDYMDYCEFNRRMSPQTIRMKKWVIKSFVAHSELTRLQDVTAAMVNDWAADQARRNISPRTINTRIRHIAAMLRYFIDMKLDMPNLHMRMVTYQQEGQTIRRSFYTREQIANVLDHCDMQQWLFIKICFDTGLRISELREMRLRHISGRMVVFPGKGGRRREVYMSQEARDRLNKWVRSRGVTDRLWRTPSGAAMSVSEIRHLMRQPFHAAGFYDFHPHALRHSFATDIQKNGATLLEAQQMLGHSSPVVTQRYLHALDGQLEACFDRLKFGAS